VRVGDTFVVTPHGIGRRGDALADKDGVRLRIRGALPGEPARVRVRHVSRGGPVAEAEFVEAPGPSHPLRREVRCPIHDACGGCGLQHADAFPLKIDEARRLLPDAWGEPIASPRAYGYRAKAFLLSDGRRWGVRPPRGPDLLDTTGCAVLRPEVEAALDVVRARLDPARARSVLVRGNRAGEVQVTVVHAGPPPALDLPFERLLLQRHDVPGNRICSDEPEVRVRGDALLERYGPLVAELPPTAFCQANPDVAESLYLAAAGELAGDRIAEFYCGAGVAGLLAARGAHLTGVDRSERAVDSARRNAARNGIEAEFRAVAAEDFDGGPFDAALVNPPRAGCHDAVLERLRACGRVVYLSCNPATLARDVDRLGFRVRLLRAADMLPQTPHLEILAVLDA